MEENKEKEKQKGLTNTKIVLMTVVGLFYDTLQAAFSWIGLGWIIMPVFYLHFWLWFRLNGEKFLSLKRWGVIAGGTVLEAASAGIIPAFTFIVLRTALDARLKNIVPVLDIMDKVK